MFSKYILDFKQDVFNELCNNITFENFGNRKIANIVCMDNNLIPIVRTTSQYNTPYQKFQPIHNKIIKKINKISDYEFKFNNAMVEIYNNKYSVGKKQMGEHTDQYLDLNHKSYICLYSCYSNLNSQPRKLKIKNKITQELSEVVLDNNSIIIFSVETNKKHLHKIVLDEFDKFDNSWLGITFRQSKTYVKYENNVVYLSDNKLLTFATDEEKKQFYHHKKQENLLVEYEWPEINYTISKSDLMCVA